MKFLDVGRDMLVDFIRESHEIENAFEDIMEL